MPEPGQPPDFLVPTAGRTKLEIFRAVRAAIEKMVEARGEKLDPAWYADGPEDRPALYDDPQTESPSE
jgi:hypothetical protein